jgi:release factor glutamine methyltransferase
MISESITSNSTAAPGLRAAQASAGQRLRRAGIDTALLDAELLLGHVTFMTAAQLLSSPNRTLTGAQAERFEDVLRRRIEREPVAYITGWREFWSLDFHVTPEVLIPRPDTERLVEIALALAAGSAPSGPPRILDLGTGSGPIGVSLAKELPFAELWATDISAAALTIARGNAARHGVAEKIRFHCGDLFEPVAGEREKFAVIVCNPPYLRSAEIAGLAPEVSRWEPHTALDGGADGMDFYRRIAGQSWSYLAPNGAVVVEIGAGMGPAVAKIFAATARYGEARIYSDYAGRERVVAAHRIGSERDRS